MGKEIYSNCYTCGEELVEGQTVIMVHQYWYCNTSCLHKDTKAVTLGENKTE